MAPRGTKTDPEPQAPPAAAASSPETERAFTRRVTWVVVVATVLTWSVIIVGAVILENLCRDRVSLIVAQRVQSILGLDPQHPISVEIGGAPLVFQLLGQRLDRVDVSAPDVSLGELVGDVELTAIGVPFDTEQPFERIEAQVRVDEDVLASVASSVTNAVIASVELAEPLVEFGTTVTIPRVEIFGVTIIQEFSFDVGIGMEPYVTEGRIAFTPMSFTVDGNELSAEAFADAYRNAAQTLMQVGAICVADQLPSVLKLESAVVEGQHLIIGLGADDAVFSNETLAERGTCY